MLVSAQGLPNDCVNFIQVCGNYDINLDVSGAGIQEIEPNVCNSFEHNSLWLRFKVEESGTLGFTLTPQSTSINEDYDFWIFGPDAACDNLSQAIRCSTTNPQAANQGNNLTGLNETSTDVSEGPGLDGDSFLQWLEVIAGEEYYLVIDRPLGQSAFQLTWTGSAVLDNPLLDYVLYSIDDIYVCDEDYDGFADYDFSVWNTSLADPIDDLIITYHRTESDALYGNNALSYPDEVQTGTYYARIMHEHSRCFDVIPFVVNMDSLELIALEVTNNDQITAYTDANVFGDVQYSLNDGEWQDSNIFMNVGSGLHTVTMRYDQCNSNELYTYIFGVTNVITPNGDGINDTWAFPGLENYEGNQLVIYDRYGKEVFNESGDKAFIWDGTYEGRKLPSSTYWYFISLPDGRLQNGHITIINK